MGFGNELFLSFVVFFLSTLAGITGIGIATLVIPILLLFGFNLSGAKASALWLNGWIMAISLIRRWKRLRWELAAPVVVAAFLAAPLGAKVSFFIPDRVQLILLGLAVALSGWLVLFFKSKRGKIFATREGFVKMGLFIGAFAGFLGGLLGIGGGIFANPAMLLLGVDPAISTSASSALVFFSSLGGWLTYTHYGCFFLKPLLFPTLFAVAGSLLGNRLAERMEREKLRKVVAFFAIGVGIFITLRGLLSF